MQLLSGQCLTTLEKVQTEKYNVKSIRKYKNWYIQANSYTNIQCPTTLEKVQTEKYDDTNIQSYESTNLIFGHIRGHKRAIEILGLRKNRENDIIVID